MTAAPSDDYQIIDDNQENDENEFESDSSSECPFNP
ncbi:unnamed protein product, partial [Rotaria magnacalcarata]